VATKLEELHVEYRDRLIVYAKGLCRFEKWIEPDDLVQHALLRLVEHGERDGDGETMSWLIKIMNNYFYDHLRREKHRQKSEEDPTVTRYAHADDELPPTYERVSRERFDWAIRKLPAKQRDTFLLRSEGLTNQQIAEKLGIAPGAVAQRLFTAREKLRKILQPYVEPGVH